MTAPPLSPGRRRAIVVMAWFVVALFAFMTFVCVVLTASGALGAAAGVLACGTAAGTGVATLNAVSLARPRSTNPLLAIAPAPAAAAVAVLTTIAVVIAVVAEDGGAGEALLLALPLSAGLLVCAWAFPAARRRIAESDVAPTS